MIRVRLLLNLIKANTRHHDISSSIGLTNGSRGSRNEDGLAGLGLSNVLQRGICSQTCQVHD